MTSSLILGAITGLTYGLLAIGLVLVYKAGRFINFAHAQLGVPASLLMGKACLDWGLSWWLAFPAAVVLGAAMGALAERLVVRPLSGRSRTTLLIATIGLSQLLLAVSLFPSWGADRHALNTRGYPLPFHPQWDVTSSLTLTGQHVLTLVLVPLLAIGLTVLLRFSLLGKAIRAAASNPDAAGQAGISVGRLATLTWGIAGGLAAVSAILAASGQGVMSPDAFGPGLLLRALGAAALGGFTSLPAAFAGGIGLGLVESYATYRSGSQGTAELVVFLVILVGLVVRSRTITRSNRPDQLALDDVTPTLVVPEALSRRWFVRHGRRSVALGSLGLGLLLPLLPVFHAPDKRFVLALTLVYAVVGVSVTMLTGWAGQVSLGQFAFVGIGAYVAAHFLLQGWSLLAGALVGGAAASLAAVVVGLPALRLKGLTLAVSTLGLAVIAPAWLLRLGWFGPPGALTLPPSGFRGTGRITSQLGLYYLVLGVLALALLAASALRSSPSGRLVLGVRDNERAALSLGYSPTGVKLGVFALSGFTAGVAGTLFALVQRNLTPDQFGAPTSLIVLAMVVLGGVRSLAGGVIGAFVMVGIPLLTSDWVESVFAGGLQFQLFLGGAGLLLTQLLNPGGIVEATRRGWEKALARLAERTPPAPDGGAAPALALVGVTVRYGGVVAVDDVALTVAPGEVVGLIGTNGAGKTTLLDAVSGLVPVSAGSSIRIGGVEVSHLAPEFRAHLGAARSFQDASLFAGLTVVEAVQVSLGRRARTGLVASLLGAPWVRSADRRTRLEAQALVDELGLARWATTLTSELSTGTRRIVDLAIQVAGRPRLLLLDEPTAGVAQRDAEAFGPLVKGIVERLGCAAVVVEHDMPLMLSLADRIYCMERGRVIAEGTPSEVRDDPRVVASYLGTDEAAISRSGAVAAPKPARKPARKAAPRPASARPARATARTAAPHVRPSEGGNA